MEAYIFLIGFTSISLRYFVIAGLAYLLFYKLKRTQWFKRKIQSVFPSKEQIRRELLFSMSSILIFFGVFALVRISGQHGLTQIYRDLSSYGWVYWFFSLAALFLIHDTYFYWTHRLLHHPRLIRFHNLHHTSNNTTPLTSFAFHPVEAVVQAGIIFVVFLMPIHIGVLALFMLGQMLFNVIGHLGYEVVPVWFHKTRVGRWFNTSTHHNMHHRYGHHNYSLYFNLWDRWLNTNHHAYETHYQKASEKMYS